MTSPLTPPAPLLRRLLLTLVALLAAGAAAAAQDWPQWRGPEGMASSEAKGLPVDFGGDTAWKLPVKGSGISSPIVSEGRVFLTTAYAGQVGSVALGKAAVPVLCGLGLVLGVVVLVRRKREGEVPAWLRFLLGLDVLAIGLATLGFAALALVADFKPETLWPPGQPGEAWFFTGGIILAGLVAAIGWFRAGSPLRLLGVLVLGVVAAQLFAGIPDNKYSDPFKTEYRLVMIAPAIAGGLWFVLLFFLARGRDAKGAFLPGLVGALALASSAGILFGVVNFWQPSAGLVRAVLCYDLATGRKLWDTPLFVAPEERKYPSNSFATPTPCADGEIVFADFGSGYACLDYDGNVLWQNTVDNFTELTRYGASTSPVMFEDTILLLHDSEINLGPSYLRALDKKTGEVLWNVERHYAANCYMTPLLMPRGDDWQLVTVTYHTVVAYDPRSGKRLWDVEVPIQQMVPGIQYDGDLLIVSGGSHLEFTTSVFELSGEGVATNAELLWKSRRAVPNVASPVLHDGLFFTINDGGVMTCFDPRTGDVHWKERLEGMFWSSLAAGDGKVYAVSEHGTVYVVAARPEFEVLGETQLEGKSFASPAIADGRVLVRTSDYLYCSGGSQTR